jgi:hypothetical protein
MQSLVRAKSGPIPASRFILVLAGVLLLIPVFPFTVFSAAFSGIALILASREAPGRGRTISIIAGAALMLLAILFTLMSIQTGTLGPIMGETTETTPR